MILKKPNNIIEDGGTNLRDKKRTETLYKQLVLNVKCNFLNLKCHNVGKIILKKQYFVIQKSIFKTRNTLTICNAIQNNKYFLKNDRITKCKILRELEIGISNTCICDTAQLAWQIP